MSEESIIIKLPMIYQVEGVLHGQRKSKMFNIFSSVDCEIPIIPDERIPDGLISEKGTTLEQYVSDNSLVNHKDYILFNEGGKWLTTNNGQQSEHCYKRSEHKNMESLRRSVLSNYEGNTQIEKLANAWESRFFREEMRDYTVFFMDSPMYTKPLDKLGDDIINHYKAYLKLRGDKVNDIKHMQKKLANFSLGIDIPIIEGELLFETPDFRQVASSNEEHCKQQILKQVEGWRAHKNRLYMPTTGLKVKRTSVIDCDGDQVSFTLQEPIIDNNVAKFHYKEYIGMNNYDIPLSVITSQPGIVLIPWHYGDNASITINGLQLEEYEIVDTITKFIKNMDKRYSNISLKGYNESLSDIKLFYNICAYRRDALDNADNCDAVMMYLDNMRNFLMVREDHGDIEYFNCMHNDMELLSKTPVNSPVNIEYNKESLKLSDAENADLKPGM